jgi:proto-chlorophyllide reductase subunit
VAYMRRRAKARIEKTARVRKLSTITRDFVLPIVSESISEAEAIGAAPTQVGSQPSHGSEGKTSPPNVPAREAAASEAVVSLGDFEWTQAAIARLHRVPEGFMRDITQTKIEEYARQHQVPVITLEVAEQGIEVGRQMMAEMIAGYSQAKQEGNGSQAAVVPAEPVASSVLNEVPSVQGTHS